MARMSGEKQRRQRQQQQKKKKIKNVRERLKQKKNGREIKRISAWNGNGVERF
jgi:hypothetical protein